MGTKGRKVHKKLAARVAAVPPVVTGSKKKYHKPGSQNWHKQ